MYSIVVRENPLVEPTEGVGPDDPAKVVYRPDLS